MIVRSILLVLCTIGLLTGDAKAQLFLENGKVTLAVSGGQRLNGSVIIHNTTPTSVNVKVYWEDFEYKAPYDGTKAFMAAGTSPTSASQWITFSPQMFSMPAFAQQNVNYTVSVPDQIQEGHYGVLFFERGTDAGMGEGDEVKLVTRVGCLFFIEPANKSKNAVIQNIGLKANSITADFVNQGNVILIPHTTYYIIQDDGVVLLRGDNHKMYVPPGASAPFEISLEKQLKPGRYTLVVNSDLDDGDVAVKEIGLATDSSGQLTIEKSQD